jgi:eukaryotic-like serine/threonine-protein kinase
MGTLEQLSTALGDRYVIDREIGRGGMATVFLARDVKHQRPVALKVLNPELGAVLGVERFLSEIRVTANLQHPNLLPLFDSGEVSVGEYAPPGSTLLFYVMPFVEGESLRARLDREKQLPVDEAIRISVAIASALDYAHRHGVIHRDLKPENILLHEGQPLIADFGIALAVSNAGGSRVTQTGLSLGTPQYMSPEQATGDRAIDKRSDIYSLAAVTYEMLAGEPPHAGSTAQAVIARLLTEKPRSVRVDRSSVPAHVDAALARALEKLPADRWATAGDFAEALQGRITAGSAPTHGSAAEPGAMRGRRSRLRDPVVLGLLAFALVATAAAAWFRLNPQDDPAVIRFPLVSGRGINLENAFIGSPIAVSPDGKHIVFVGSDDRDVSQLFIRSLDGLESRRIPGSDGAFMPFFSPDGRWIGFWASGRLLKVPLSGGAPLTIAEVPIIFGATWSAQGFIVVASNNNLAIVAENGGAFRQLTVRPESLGVADQYPVALGDGEQVAFARIGAPMAGGSELAIVSISTGEVRMLGVPGSSPIGYVDGTLVYVNPPNGLFAVRLDLRAGKVAGTPMPLPGDVMVGAGGAAKAALSASGTLAFQSGSRAARLVHVQAGATPTPFLPGDGVWSFPRISPDRTKIALTVASGARSDIWIYDIASSTPTRITTEGRVNERPEWSPDGSRVLYRTDRGPRSSIWWQPIDQSAPATPLIASPLRDYYEAVITSDGRWVVYQLDTLQSDIYYRELHGDSTSHPITASGFSEDMARVSPDARWVAYQTNESGRSQVVVQPFPGPGGRIQISAEGGTEPLWSHDGSRLFYRQGRRVLQAVLRTEPDFRVLSRAVLFDGDYLPASAPHANYDIAPDGNGFIMLEGVGDPQIVLVHNWRRELRAILRGRQ